MLLIIHDGDDDDGDVGDNDDKKNLNFLTCIYPKHTALILPSVDFVLQ